MMTRRDLRPKERLVVRLASGTPLEAREVGGAVGRGVVALRPPDRLGETFDRLVQRVMPLARALEEGGESAGDAGWLVDRELLLERHVQAHVQEGVALVDVILVAVALGPVEHRVVLRVR